MPFEFNPSSLISYSSPGASPVDTLNIPAATLARVTGAASPSSVDPSTGLNLSSLNPVDFKFGMNMPTFNAALGGLQTLGSLWNAFQANSLMKKSINAQTKFAQANLDNQTQSYNTTIADRARNRAFVEGTGQAAVDDYIAKNSLPSR